VDETIPIFRWYWGIPEVLSAELYADLRILASTYYYGQLTRENGQEMLDLTTDQLLGVMLAIGLDIDVLFGLLFDAGASVTGSILGELALQIQDNELVRNGPCFTFRMDLYAYFDPCPFCPTPVIEVGDNIIKAQDPPNCSLWGGPDQSAKAKVSVLPTEPLFTKADRRLMFRHPDVAFDSAGQGTC
jgi:hypothetical protein